MLGLPLLLAVVTAKYIQMDFDIYHANSVHDLAQDPKSRRNDVYFAKRDGSVSMELQNSQTFYMTNLHIGSNGDKQGVLVDTGSSDLWVMASSLTCRADSYSKREMFDSFVKDKQVYSREDISEALGDDQVPVVVREDNNENQNDSKAKRATPTSDEDAGENKFGWIFSTIIVPDNIGGLPSAVAGGGSNTCTQYGSFNTEASDSFKRNESAPSFQIQYADGTDAYGIWGTDTVVIGNTSVESLSFAVANNTSSDVGVLGIGLPGLEVTNSNARSAASAYQYANLPIKLREQGSIAKAAYSVYLGRQTASTGTILFGAVDHAKYSGQLTTVPILNSYAKMGYENPIRLEVAVDNLAVTSSSSNVSITSNTYGAVLDTGSTLSYFPQSLLDKLAGTLGATYSYRQQAYTIPCSTGSSNSLIVNFSGLRINVPLSDLAVQVTRDTCILGILEQSSQSSYILFGDNVLRNIYAVFDLDDYEISLAQVNYSGTSDIEEIGSSVPSAVKAAGYSSTAIETNVSEGSATSTVGLSSGDSSHGTSKNGSTKPGAPTMLLFFAFSMATGILLL
jgi:candidapepsin/yapsin 1